MAAPGAPAGGATAGNGSGDAGGEAAQQGHQNGNGNGQPDGGPDYGKLSQQLERLVGGQEQLRQWLANGGPEGEYDGDYGEGDDFELDGLEGFDDDAEGLEGEPDGLDPDGEAEQLAERLGEQFDAATREAMAPLAEELAQQRGDLTTLRQEAELRDLINEFPDLGDEQTSRQVVEAAHGYAQSLGNPALANEAGFIRLVYLGGRAIDAAQNEGAETPPAAHLEGGGGPASAGARAADPADRILNAKTKRGASVLDGI